MKTEYIKLSDYSVALKQLISGPAPVGRILNYLILAGKGTLKHRNGYRSLDLKDGIASAWCSELMVGLGLVYYIEESGKVVYPLLLTENGKKLFELLKDRPNDFDESSDPTKCKSDLITTNKTAYDLFFKIFKSSPVCINLCKYIINAGTNTFSKIDFYDNYFKCFKEYYDGAGTMEVSVRNAGFNRVPSLNQLCDFFGCLSEDKKYYIFNYDELAKISEDYEFIPLDTKKIEELKKEDSKEEKIVSDLVAKYGIDGTVAREIITRNSAVQSLFRNNLIARYGCKCAICSKEIETVMIASHIVPASEADVIEKADCENGLLLCSLHDKLFDRYLITFDFESGKLIYAECLKDHLDEYQLSEDLHLEERFMTEERKNYLMQHNMAFYERNK